MNRERSAVDETPEPAIKRFDATRRDLFWFGAGALGFVNLPAVAATATIAAPSAPAVAISSVSVADALWPGVKAWCAHHYASEPHEETFGIMR